MSFTVKIIECSGYLAQKKIPKSIEKLFFLLVLNDFVIVWEKVFLGKDSEKLI